MIFVNTVFCLFGSTSMSVSALRFLQSLPTNFHNTAEKYAANPKAAAILRCVPRICPSQPGISTAALLSRLGSLLDV